MSNQLMKVRLFNDLLQRIHNGDMSALLPIYKTYYGKMLADAKFILKNTADGEDAANDAFVSLIDHVKSDKFTYYVINPGGYMHTLLKRAAFTIYDSRKNVNIDRVDPLSLVRDDRTDVKLIRADIANALKYLSPRQHEIAIMYYFYGYIIRDICEELDLSEGTVKWNLNQIRDRLYMVLSRK